MLAWDKHSSLFVRGGSEELEKFYDINTFCWKTLNHNLCIHSLTFPSFLLKAYLHWRFPLQKRKQQGQYFGYHPPTLWSTKMYTASHVNIRQGWKGLPGTAILAWFCWAPVLSKKRNVLYGTLQLLQTASQGSFTLWLKSYEVKVFFKANYFCSVILNALT